LLADIAYRHDAINLKADRLWNGNLRDLRDISLVAPVKGKALPCRAGIS